MILRRFKMTKFKRTLAHYQLGANVDKLGGWENAMAIADAIESGEHDKVRQLVEPYPQGWGLVERIVEVAAAHR
jgi:hypothetical protein